jgi:hypothetical protein
MLKQKWNIGGATQNQIFNLSILMKLGIERYHGSYVDWGNMVLVLNDTILNRLLVLGGRYHETCILFNVE